VVGGELIVEVKSVKRLNELHEAHVFTCLKLSGYPVALLVNFDVPALRIRRLVLHAAT
jgi:GxxExxY protein